MVKSNANFSAISITATPGSVPWYVLAVDNIMFLFSAHAFANAACVYGDQWGGAS